MWYRGTLLFARPASSTAFALLALLTGLGQTHAQTPTTPAPPATIAPTSPVYLPLDSSERWDNFFRTTVGDSTFFGSALLSAGYSQLTKDPPEWGEGAEAYARRTASWLGIYGIRETVHQAGAAMLGYDPRYLPCDCTGFFHRTGHAIAWTFLTKNNEGKTRLDLPEFAGTYGAGMISTYWFPARFQPLSDGVRIANQQMTLTVGLSFLKEFAPDLRRAFIRKH